MKTGLSGLMEAVAGRETGIIPSRMFGEDCVALRTNKKWNDKAYGVRYYCYSVVLQVS